MATKIVTVTQTAIDTLTNVTVETGLGITDTTTVWKINLALVRFAEMDLYPAFVNWEVSASIRQTASDLTIEDRALVAKGGYKIVSSAGAGTAQPSNGLVLDKIVQMKIFPDDLIAGSQIFLSLNSIDTGIINSAVFRFDYDLVKVSALEYQRLLNQACVC